jgi:hypothetical protein
MLRWYFTGQHSLTFNWWQWKLYKLAHVGFGLAVGAMWADFVRPWLTVLWLLVGVLVLSMGFVAWRHLDEPRGL